MMEMELKVQEIKVGIGHNTEYQKAEGTERTLDHEGRWLEYSAKF